MFKKLSKKRTRAITIFFVVLIGIVSVASLVWAQGACPDDKCPPESSDKKVKNIKLQIFIPGVDQCTYWGTKVEKGVLKPVKKTCNYIGGNLLPRYIKILYQFSIGVIAILAVIMIMIGGLGWIFAAGNPGKIGKAKEQISSAIAGLILALCSYLILVLINPNLVNLNITGLYNIQAVQEENWCGTGNRMIGDAKLNFPGGEGTLRYSTKPDPASDSASEGVVSVSHLECGETYYWGYFSSATGETLFYNQGMCNGSGGCKSDQYCLPESSGKNKCFTLQQFCETPDKDCGAKDAIIKDYIAGYGCGFYDAASDACLYGEVLICEGGDTERIKCIDGAVGRSSKWEPGKGGSADEGELTYCAYSKDPEESDDSVKPVRNCAESGVRAISFIKHNNEYERLLGCCESSTGVTSRTVKGCLTVSGCGNYDTQDACEADHCRQTWISESDEYKYGKKSGQTNIKCVWSGGTCIGQTIK